VEADVDTFKSIEGNTNDEGSAEGSRCAPACTANRGLDFVIV
jgi:hypothetical protein